MYIIEGNIGAGKSTLLKLIQKKLPHLSVIFEPLQAWQTEEQGESILKNFYQDPHRWAYTIETLALIHRVRDHIAEQHKSPLCVMERSIYSGRYCFAQNGFNNGYLTPLEWNLYNQWFEFLVPSACKPPLGFIYLKTNPYVAYERIKKRARGTESTISLDYLKQIDHCHEQFLIKKKSILSELKKVPVLVLDCDEEFELDYTYQAQLLKEVDLFITRTLPIPKDEPHELAAKKYHF